MLQNFNEIVSKNEELSPEGRRKPPGIGCPHRIVVLTGLSSSLDSRSYARIYLGPYIIEPYLGPYLAALFSLCALRTQDCQECIVGHHEPIGHRLIPQPPRQTNQCISYLNMVSKYRQRFLASG